MELKSGNRRNSLNPEYFIVFLFLSFFLLLSVGSVRTKSLTYDEPYHYQYGMNILDGNSTRFDDSKMPFSAWNALPAKIASYLSAGVLKDNLEKMVAARLMTTLFSLLIALMVFYWSRKLYGFIPGIISLGLYLLDPNIIAHSQLVTTDIYVTGMILLCSYWLWKFANSRRWQDGLMFSIMLALAQLAKYTAVSLYPVLAFIFLAYDGPRIIGVVRKERGSGLLKETLRYSKYLLVVALISIVIINIGFLFNRPFTPLREYQFYSEIFKSIQAKINFVVPTPYPYLEGLDLVTLKERTNLSFIHIYLLGETRFGQGFPGYYFIASLLKVPVATQLIVLASLFLYFRSRERRKLFWRNEWFLLGLVLFYTIYFNFFYKAQIGIRYYLVVFPLLYIFAGGLFTEWRSFSRVQKGIAFALALYLMSSVLFSYPNYLAYFNELIGDRKQAYKYLADSNLDWGQDEFVFKQYRKEHRKIRKAPEIPALLTEPVTYYVSVNRLVGVVDGPEHYRWLRENFEPVDVIGSSYLIYKITPDQMSDLCENTNFCQ
jgi:hypothetical protein